MILVVGFGGKKRGGDGDYYYYLVVMVKGGWSGCSSREESLGMCSSVETWGFEGFDCGGCGAVSRRCGGGGEMPWS